MFRNKISDSNMLYLVPSKTEKNYFSFDNFNYKKEIKFNGVFLKHNSILDLLLNIQIEGIIYRNDLNSNQDLDLISDNQDKFNIILKQQKKNGLKQLTTTPNKYHANIISKLNFLKKYLNKKSTIVQMNFRGSNAIDQYEVFDLDENKNNNSEVKISNKIELEPNEESKNIIAYKDVKEVKELQFYYLFLNDFITLLEENELYIKFEQVHNTNSDIQKIKLKFSSQRIDIKLVSYWDDHELPVKFNLQDFSQQYTDKGELKVTASVRTESINKFIVEEQIKIQIPIIILFIVVFSLVQIFSNVAINIFTILLFLALQCTQFVIFNINDRLKQVEKLGLQKYNQESIFSQENEHLSCVVKEGTNTSICMNCIQDVWLGIDQQTSTEILLVQDDKGKFLNLTRQLELSNQSKQVVFNEILKYISRIEFQNDDQYQFV